MENHTARGVMTGRDRQRGKAEFNVLVMVPIPTKESKQILYNKVVLYTCTSNKSPVMNHEEAKVFSSSGPLFDA